MKVSYSPRFALKFKSLPPTVQERFKLIDAEVKRGNIVTLRRNAWVYSYSVGGGFLAWGNHFADKNEFYWRSIDPPALVPIIL